MANSPLPNMSSGQTVTAEIWNTQVNEINDHETRISNNESGKAAKTTQINTASGSGLTGGGDLSANRSLAVSFGDTATTVATGLRAKNLETLTGDAAKGNAALDTRLGATVTTTNTVSGYIGDTTKVGTGTDGSLATGSVGAQLGNLKTRVGSLETGGSGGGGGLGSAVTVFASGTAGQSVTSTSFTPATNVSGLTFVVPPSGKVRFDWVAGVTAGAASPAYALAGIEVRTGSTIGSGSVVLAPTLDIGTMNTGFQAELAFMNFWMLDGSVLTAGNTYNVRMMYIIRTSGGTATFSRAHLMVTPLLA